MLITDIWLATVLAVRSALLGPQALLARKALNVAALIDEFI